MEFVAQFIEIIVMLLLLFGLGFALLYFMRHRERFSRWVNNFDRNTDEKGEEIIRLKRRIEDAQHDINKLADPEPGE